MTTYQYIRTILFRWASNKVVLGSMTVVIVLGLLLLRAGGSRKTVTHQAFYPVKRGDFLVSVVEGGTIKAVREVTVRCELEGTSRIISIAPEGTYVEKGDMLVELDSSDLRERITLQEVTYQNARFAMLQAQEYLAIQKSVAESNVKDAELKMKFARTDLKKFEEGEVPQAITNAASKITIAQMELEQAKDRLHWTLLLEKKGYTTRSELEADKLSLRKHEIGVAAATADLQLLTTYDLPKKKEQLSASLEQAGMELERIKQRSNAQVAQAEADLKSKSTAAELQKTRLDQLHEQLTLTKIHAPEAGLVVYASSSNPGSGVLIEEGATVRQKQDLIKLPDISQMMVEIRVHESHVQEIKPGLPAYITIDSLPDYQFHGVVRKVAVLPDSTSRFFNPNLKVYTTEIVIDDELPDVKPGISARAEIVITNLSQVLTVPMQAVTTIKGQPSCLVRKDGAKLSSKPVEIGLYNERFIEIKSGLQEGDEVLLSALASSDNIDLSGSIIGDGDTESTNRTVGSGRAHGQRTTARVKVNSLPSPTNNAPQVAPTSNSSAIVSFHTSAAFIQSGSTNR
jgi:HlyD family secretion protein